jgi:hypothetical protein
MDDDMLMEQVAEGSVRVEGVLGTLQEFSDSEKRHFGIGYGVVWYGME